MGTEWKYQRMEVCFCDFLLLRIISSCLSMMSAHIKTCIVTSHFINLLLTSTLGIYRGQWFKGMRHGHGVRISVPYYQATHYRQSKSSTFHQSKSLKSSLSSIQSDFDDSNAMRDSKSDLERAGFVLRGLRTNNESDSSNLSGNITPETSRKTTFQKKIGSNFKRTLAKKFGKYKKSENGDSSRWEFCFRWKVLRSPPKCCMEKF